MATRRPLIAGNWKMNGLSASVEELDRIIQGFAPEFSEKIDLLVCPPFTLIEEFAATAKGTQVMIGAQDCHPEPSGAHTGDISAEMLADAGVKAVIVGHSERRAEHHEDDRLVRAKADAAFRAGLLAVVCVGETRAERESKQTLDVVSRQLSGSVPDGAGADRLVIAYEPVWAIGSGLTPSPNDIAEVHGLIRSALSARFGAATGAATRILYGGSVKPDNAGSLLKAKDVDGALVGGASLKAGDFLTVARGAL
ncbi:MAG TPA: triose-phosphate isomerase [Xanthobacteraceae bacterium]|nr:triose-phosphate isomerase [Xanthobacteraceae bacterium]